MPVGDFSERVSHDSCLTWQSFVGGVVIVEIGRRPRTRDTPICHEPLPPLKNPNGSGIGVSFELV